MSIVKMSIVDYMINGYDPDVLFAICDNGFHQSVGSRLVKEYLEKNPNFDINTKIRDTTVLISASLFETNSQIVNLLLEKGADPNIRNKNGWTALMFASKNGCIKIVSSLLSYGADPNNIDKKGRSAIELASYWCNYEIVVLLLKAGAKLIFKNTALMVTKHHKEQIRKKIQQLIRRYSTFIALQPLTSKWKHLRKPEQLTNLTQDIIITIVKAL
jgi:hypothetical protein